MTELASGPGPTSGELQRGAVLLDQGRADLAEQALRRHLATSPGDALGLALLALALLGLERKDAALQAAQDSVASDPDEPMAHYSLARSLLENDKYTPAAAAAEEVIRLEPEHPRGYAILAAVRFGQRRFDDCLKAAEASLALEPENPMALSIRGLALTQLGRQGEARQTFNDALRQDPENPFAIASQGFTDLHAGRMREALDGFRDALRIDPGNDFARIGLVEALKARSPLYAALLRFFLWTSRLSGRGQLLLYGGLFLFNRSLRGILRAQPELAPIVLPAFGLYVGFIWLTYAAVPMFNLLLRFDSLGRHALSEEQRAGANAIAPFVVVGLPAAVAALITQATPAIYLAVVSLGLVIPVSLVFAAERAWARAAFALYSFVTLGVGLAAVVIAAGILPTSEAAASNAFYLAVGLIVVSTWLSVPMAASRRRR
jgi:tetratricopeptide (TPR) repeat protein